MFIRKKFAIVVLLLLSVGSSVWSQVLPTTPPVYVSGGANIYTLTNGTLTPIFTNANANFESLAIGPDNVDSADAVGNAKYAYFLYACDPAGTITRIAFLPAATSATPPTVAGSEVVYNGSVAGLAPVCGRSSSAGDFYITNKSGAGVFTLSGIANIGFGVGGPFPTPTAVALNPKFLKGMIGRGITQKYVGDLLIVDNFNNQVVRSPYAVPFATQSTLISSNLNGPIGVVNAPSLRQIFVSNSNSSKAPVAPAVSIFDASGAPSTTTCPSGLSLPNNNHQVPDYLATAPTDQFPTAAPNTVITDTIYLVTSANTKGTLWSWNTSQAPGSCSLTPVATVSNVLSGIAVAPAPVTLTLPEIGSAANPVPTPFFFNSSLFQFTATGCNATVTAYPRSLLTIDSMIRSATGVNANQLNSPAATAANLGDGGFETAYEAYNPSCNSVFPDGGFLMDVFNFVDNGQFTNPRILDCTDIDHTNEPQLVGGATTCVVPPTIGVYPLGGPIPGDTGGRVSGGTSNFFAVVNENAGAGTAEPGNFCGFQSPLLNPTDPGYPFSFPAGSRSTINVKFKLSSDTHCKQNFITDATALISVAQLSPTFNAINVLATASSLDVVPLFNQGNQQYSFTLNVATLPAGTYSLTVTFLTNNTTNKTILFVVN